MNLIEFGATFLFELPIVVFLALMLPARYGKGPFSQNAVTVSMLQGKWLFGLFVFVFCFSVLKIALAFVDGST
jgi:hypothetical protein